jgi:hypothetical protein
VEAVRGAKTLAIALAASAAIPASAGAATRQKSVYSVVKASGSEKVSFTSDTSTCARFMTCGYRGTVRYKFGGKPHGTLVMRRDRRGHITGAASFRTTGTTTSAITAGGDCQDTVRHRSEVFTLNSRSRLGRLLFGLHGTKTDYLFTDCIGPTEAALKADRALPEGFFKRKDFEGSITKFQLSGSASFREQGWRGSTTWRLAYRIARHSCSPNCR